MHRGPATMAPADPTPTPQGSGTVDSLPKQFVVAMRTLFDIMDDQRTGYVRFTDIENRWQDDGSKGLPRGVIESLRKVTPPSGMLSFERFCGGLKICLLRNQVETRVRIQPPEPCLAPQRPPSAPLLDLDNTSSITKTPWNNTAAVRPNNAMPQQRALSMPQLMPEDAAEVVPKLPTVTLHGPPKPPRTAAGLERASGTVAPERLDKAEIRNALQNWQLGLMMGDENKDKRTDQNYVKSGVPQRTGRSLGDGQTDQQVGLYQKKPNVRRREPRRHTLQNGIDYNMLKRMKQIEQERDVLLQGLTAVEKAREWYLKKVSSVQEKMRYLGRMGSHMEQWTEAHQERLDLQRARVLEVNRHLAALADTWERGGLPMHMNLAVRQCRPVPVAQPGSQEMTSRLKQQNRMLTDEVSQKSEKITALEREKAALIRELLQSRGRSVNSGSNEEAVF